MRSETMYQIIVLLTMTGAIVSLLKAGAVFRITDQRRTIAQSICLIRLCEISNSENPIDLFENQAIGYIELQKKTYFLGNSWVKSFLYPRYAYVKKGMTGERFQIFMTVDEDKVEVRGIKGSIYTLEGESSREKDKIFILKNGDALFINGLYKMEIFLKRKEA